MKIKRIFIMFLLLSSFIFPLTYVKSFSVVPDYYNKGNQYAYAYGQNVRTFYSNYTRRFYTFSRGTNYFGSDPCTLYASSFDGNYWTELKVLFPYQYPWFDDYLLSQERLDFWLEENGKYLWYIKIKTGTSPNTLTIGRLELKMDGTIYPSIDGGNFSDDWFTTDQIVYDTYPYLDWEVWDGVSICTNESGHPFIAFTCRDISNGEQWYYVAWTDVNDGTWGTTYQKYYLEIGGSKRVLNGNNRILPMKDGKVIWILCCGNDEGSGLRERWFTYVWDKTNWNYKSMDQDNVGGLWLDNQWSATSYDDFAMSAYIDSDLNWDRLMIESKKGLGDWINETVIYSWSTRFNEIQPFIASDRAGNIIVIWWNKDNDTYYYRRRYANHTWESNYHLWRDLDFNVDGRQMGYFGQLYGLNENTNPVCLEFRDDDFPYPFYHDYMFIGYSGESLDPLMAIYNITIYNSDGTINDGWLFEGEVYELETYIKGFDFIQFNFSDTRHIINFNFDNSSKILDIYSNNEFVIGGIFTEYEDLGNNITRILWRFILDKNIVDCSDTPLYLYGYNEDLNFTYSGYFGITFNIYNLGGKGYYDFYGDGFHTTGGNIFELGATNGTSESYSSAYMIFRRLQHAHFLMEFDMDNSWDAVNDEFDFDGGGYYEIGIDYRLNSTWVRGWKVRIYPSLANVGNHAGGVDHDWVGWKIEWFNRWDDYYHSAVIKEDIIYSNFYGYDHASSTHGYTNRTSAELWIDLWFDSLNSSEVVAGRVNSYYYGMYEQGNPFWFGYGTFRPMIGDVDVSLFYDDLMDENCSVMNVIEVNLCRLWVNVTKVIDVDGDDDTWEIINYEFGRKTADDRMEGINTPTEEQTKSLEMPQTGFTARIVQALDNIGNVIWKGALNFVKILVASMDSFLVWLGFDTGFISKAWEFLISLPQIIIKIVDQLGVIVSNFLESLDNLFSLLTIGLYNYMMFVKMLIDTFVSYWTQIVSLFTGGWENVSNIWSNFSIYQWIQLFLIGIFPFWELDRIARSNDSFKTVREDFKFFIDMLLGIIGLFSKLISIVINLIGSILDRLPF